MNKSLLTAALILGLVSAPVGAGSPPSFGEADTDSDGSLSRQEAEAVKAISFEQVDANGDGRISASEYKQAAQGPIGTPSGSTEDKGT